MNAPLGYLRMDDFESIRKEAIQECIISGVRIKTIAEFFGCSVGLVSQYCTPAMRKIRKQEIERRETAIIMRRLGELKLRVAAREGTRL